MAVKVTRYYIRPYPFAGHMYWAVVKYYPEHEPRPPLTRHPVSINNTLAKAMRNARRRIAQTEKIRARINAAH